ncbi:acyltransferase family protein [Vibrio splendidus]|uniref:acyltransferase family protein n=2 Tax=Vibrio TaxID=662 RepID=UPI0039A4F1B3
MPVLGSYFMIVANQQSSVITNNKVFQLLGKWSYSIYLWHWPLVVAIQYFNLDGYFIYLGILLSIIFGMLSHTYIESVKFRNEFFNISSYLKCKPLYIVVLVGVLGVASFEMDGFDFRSKNLNYSYVIEKERLIPNHGLSNTCEGEFTLSSKCRTDERPEVLVFGDSFAMHLVPGILSSNSKSKIIQHTKSSCGPFFEITKNTSPEFAESCLDFTQEVKDWVIKSEGITTVVLASPFDYIDKIIRFRDGGERKITIDELNDQFTSTLDFFIEHGIRPVVFTPPPETGVNIGKCLTSSSFMNESYNHCDFNINEITTRQKDIYAWLDRVSDKYKVVDVREMLCKHGECSTHDGDIYIYRDKHHLSYEGSRKLGEDFDFYKLITK